MIAPFVYPTHIKVTLQQALQTECFWNTFELREGIQVGDGRR